MSNMDTLREAVRVMADTAIENEKYFCELDAATGDGDFGYSLARGFESVPVGNAQRDGPRSVPSRGRNDPDQPAGRDVGTHLGHRVPARRRVGRYQRNHRHDEHRGDAGCSDRGNPETRRRLVATRRCSTACAQPETNWPPGKTVALNPRRSRSPSPPPHGLARRTPKTSSRTADARPTSGNAVLATKIPAPWPSRRWPPDSGAVDLTDYRHRRNPTKGDSAMKRFMNDPKNFVTEVLAGVAAANPNTLRHVPEYNLIVRADAPVSGKVAIIQDRALDTNQPTS